MTLSPRLANLPLLFLAIAATGCGMAAQSPMPRAEGAFTSSAKAEPIERGRVVEMKLFVSRDAHDRLLGHYEREGLIVKTSPMVSYYFDAFDRSSRQFVLQNRPEGGAKFRFRVKEREGAKPKTSIQTKSRYSPTVFPMIEGLPFSVRFTEEMAQELDREAVRPLQKSAEAAADLFVTGSTPASFAAGARQAGSTFLNTPSGVVEAFGQALAEAGGTEDAVVFGGALWNVRRETEPLKTPEGVTYDFELDAYRLAVAPGQMVSEFAVEAGLAPGETEQETKRRVDAVTIDLARRLRALGVGPADALPPKEAMSDPLGPNGGYMGPVAKRLAESMKPRKRNG